MHSPTLFAMFHLFLSSSSLARTSREFSNKSSSFSIANPTEMFLERKFMQIYAEKSFFDVLEEIVGKFNYASPNEIHSNLLRYQPIFISWKFKKQSRNYVKMMFFMLGTKLRQCLLMFSSFTNMLSVK